MDSLLFSSSQQEIRVLTLYVNIITWVHICSIQLLSDWNIIIICGVGWCVQITVETDRTVVAFYKFLKKNASIPFKLQKPTSTPKPASSDAKESEAQSSSSDVKDELWGFN